MLVHIQAPELLQQTAAENAERQIDLEEAGAFMFFFYICFDVELEKPTTWLAVRVGMTNIYQKIPKLSCEF